jgi:hypothetical protein
MPADMLLHNIIDILNIVDTNYNSPDLSMLLLKRLVNAMCLY